MPKSIFRFFFTILVLVSFVAATAHAAGSSLTLPVKFVFTPKLTGTALANSKFVKVIEVLTAEDKPFAIVREDNSLRAISEDSVLASLSKVQVKGFLNSFVKTTNLWETKNGSLKGIYDDDSSKFASEFFNLFSQSAQAEYIDEDLLEMIETMSDEYLSQAFELLATNDMYLDSDLLMMGLVSYQEIFDMAAVGLTTASYDSDFGVTTITRSYEMYGGDYINYTTYYESDGSSSTYRSWGDDTGPQGYEKTDDDSAGENFLDMLFGEQDITAESEAGRMLTAHKLTAYVVTSIFEKDTTLSSFVNSYTSGSISSAIFKKQFAAAVTKAMTNNTRFTKYNLNMSLRLR